MNAVALEFVMDIDEIIYSALAPFHLKKMLAQVQPIPLPPSPTFNKLDLGAVFTMVGVVVSLVLIVVLGIEPRINTLRDARHALCGGVTDFVFTLKPDGSPVWSGSPTSPSAPPATEWKRPADEWKKLSNTERTIDNVISGYGNSNKCDATENATMSNHDCTMGFRPLAAKYPHFWDEPNWLTSSCW